MFCFCVHSTEPTSPNPPTTPAGSGVTPSQQGGETSATTPANTDETRETGPEAIEDRGIEQFSSEDDGLSVGAAVAIGVGGAAVLLTTGYFAMRR